MRSMLNRLADCLKLKISEHRNNINKKTANLLVISEHKMNINHEFDWKNIKILDNERFLSKRLIFKILNI